MVVGTTKAPASRHALTHALTAVALALASLTPRAARILARPPFKTCNTSRTCTLLTHLSSHASLDSGTLLSLTTHVLPVARVTHSLSSPHGMSSLAWVLGRSVADTAAPGAGTR